MTEPVHTHSACKEQLKAVNDAMDILKGKWKISIVTALFFYENRRFSDILGDVKGISNKMLSKELKELEMNKLVTRTVTDTTPVSVFYELTKYGRQLQSVIECLAAWGAEHRRLMFGKIR